MTIYYATARLGFEPPPGPGGVPQSPEEYLNGMFEGRLRWVSGYAGANSSVAVVVDGKTVMMNVALRNSRTTDSDEDGVPNYFDATPLGGGEIAGAARPSVSATIGSNGPQGRGLAISWNAAPKS
ncbi:hypothetical protein EG829_19640, partial [bacterium]|nr:hypothetical protein [bacterium]